ncbi:hypothetical protein BDZ94DRAFT_1277549 [Collybia nuda]|uniref:Uncharacterized protein n=1 Tax=Collybia nuda TaxID=64659 RepID=A0A9P5XU15_9AGAR|nr:hypothetical protein BDZ94DRAFT_1277549 [Collybia nuda]
MALMVDVSVDESALSDLSPLLGRAHTPTSVLPDISLAISAIANTPANEINCEQFDLQSLPNYALQSAFKLVVLLQLRRKRLQPVNSNDLFETWSREARHIQEAKILEDKAAAVWDSFLQDYRNPCEIKTALWSQFPMQQGKYQPLRVVDFLVDRDSPASMISHPMVMSGLTHIWEHGFYPVPPRSSGLQSALRCYNTLASPRSFHFIELSSHIGFLFLLSHYLLYPYEKPHTWTNVSEFFGWRECSLILFPLSFALRSRPRSSMIFLLVPLSFLLGLPFPPSPGDFSFTVLLWGFFLHILQLHLPSPPSPLFLLSKHHTLSFAVFISERLSTILCPVVLFFLPTFLFASFLLSISLVDTFGKLLIHPSAYMIQDLPSPSETRLAFLTLLIAVIGLAIFSAFALATSPDTQVNSLHSWDKYSEEIGLAARKSYYRAIRSYSRIYTFPPPFNILHLFIIQTPELVLRTRFPRVEKYLWRAVVGPFVILSALLFLGIQKGTSRFRRTMV